jgi:hypothetical protein
MTRHLLLAFAMATIGCGSAPAQPAESAEPEEPGQSAPRLQLIAPDGDTSRAFVVLSELSAPLTDALGKTARSDEEWSKVLAVFVNDEQAPPANTPAVLGRYRLVEHSLRFEPLFGFDAGRRYRVRFDPGALGGEVAETVEPVETILSLPKADVAPTTIVEVIYPSSDTLPENQLKLYIHFSAPMRMGDGLPFIKLLDSTGREVVDPFLPLGGEFWDRERRRYTVFFDPGRVKRGILPNEQMGRPLREGGEYSLVVDGSWLDAEGHPLRESYRKTFRVGPPDETPLDTATWSLAVPRASTRDALVVDFPEPLDHGLMARALSIESKDGRLIEGAIEIRENEAQWVFTPAEPWEEGGYRLVAMSILEDLAGNQIGGHFEVDVFDRVERPEQREVYRVSFEVTQ